MNTEKIVMCVVALLVGMLVANMLTNVCGCKNTVEGLKFNNQLPSQISGVEWDKKFGVLRQLNINKTHIDGDPCGLARSGEMCNDSNNEPTRTANPLFSYDKCNSHNRTLMQNLDKGFQDELCNKSMPPKCGENNTEPCDSDDDCQGSDNCSRCVPCGEEGTNPCEYNVAEVLKKGKTLRQCVAPGTSYDPVSKNQCTVSDSWKPAIPGVSCQAPA